MRKVSGAGWWEQPVSLTYVKWCYHQHPYCSHELLPFVGGWKWWAYDPTWPGTEVCFSFFPFWGITQTCRGSGRAYSLSLLPLCTCAFSFSLKTFFALDTWLQATVKIPLTGDPLDNPEAEWGCRLSPPSWRNSEVPGCLFWVCLCCRLLETVLGYINTVAQSVEKNVDKLTVKFWRALLSKAYDMLDKVGFHFSP